MERIFVNLGLGAILVACVGCTQRDNQVVSDAMSSNTSLSNVILPPADTGSNSTARSNQRESEVRSSSDVLDRILDRGGRKSLTVDFRGEGPNTTVVYGRFSKDIAVSSPDYKVADFLYPGEEIEDISAGDYGVVISAAPGEKPIAMATGNDEIFKIVEPTDRVSECWKPRGKEQGVYVARETAGGILYYHNGWKWAQCGD